MLIRAVLIDYPPRRFIGAELATWALLEDLARDGHRVEVRSPAAPPSGVRGPGGIPVLPLEGATGDGAAAVVTHAYEGPDLVAAAGAGGAPVIVMAHSSDLRIRRGLALRPGALVVANSLGVWRELGAHEVARPPSPAPRGPVPERARGGRAPVLGFVNGAVLKGGRALEALVRARGRDWQVLGVRGGYGRVPPMVGALCEGPWPPAEMGARYFDRIDVHLLPSLSESWGMAALEALSHGVPVVASDLPGVREALDGVPGRWIGWAVPGDPRSLETAVEALLGLPEATADERAELGAVLDAKADRAAGDRAALVRKIGALAEITQREH